MLYSVEQDEPLIDAVRNFPCVYGYNDEYNYINPPGAGSIIVI